jgi:hypothetical protein
MTRRIDIVYNGRNGQRLRQEVYQSQVKAQRRPQRTLRGDLRRIGGWINRHLLERYSLLLIMAGCMVITYYVNQIFPI